MIIPERDGKMDKKHMTNEASNINYYSDRLQLKLSLLATSKAAVVEAPSGYGKSTAIRDYLDSAAKHGDDVFWFAAVDEAPAALFQRLCSKIMKIDGSAGERLRTTDFPNAFTIGEVCDALRSIKCSRKTWLVIDNFQLFAVILPPSFLAALLEHNENRLHVVIITQALGRNFLPVVAEYGVLHITASDLRWDTEDIRRYFSISGEKITKSAASEVARITDGWVIAVRLQLCAYEETGAFTDKAVSQLMEHLIWNKLTREQQDFLMRASVFESCTTKRLCSVLNCDTLPDYAVDNLTIPFIHYIVERQLCVPHSILLEMVCMKRREQGEAFENECLMKAGDVCRDDGETAEAMAFYMRIKDYRRILSLDLSRLICAKIGDKTFQDIALEIAQSCPIEIRHEYPLSMLCVAWAVRNMENEAEFGKLMDELDNFLPETGALRAEWLLLSAYLHYPHLDEMISIVQKAAVLFGGACSGVILPEAPWAFYEYLQLPAFHIKVGAADEEADMLEKFIRIYSRLTGGHGAGADALFRAELAFFRCETAKAEIFAYKAIFLAENKQQKIVQIGAARILASIALLKSDSDGWLRAVNAVEHAVSGSAQNTPTFRIMLDVVHGTLLAQLRDYSRIADWLKNVDFMSRKLPVSIYNKALAVHGYYLMGQGKYTRLVGFLQSIALETYTPFPEHFHFFSMAVGYSSAGNKAQAIACLRHAAKKSLPDGMLHCFVGFSRLLQSLSDELIENSYPHLLPRFKEYRKQYYAGWFTLYDAMVANELPAGLTVREHEVALLAAEGLHNNEIAEKLFVSENTVRAHLRTIYQKLDIDRRARLAEKLK